MKKTSGGALLTVLCWTALTVVFDVTNVGDIRRQARSAAFAATKGKVLSSESVQEGGGEDAKYHVEVRYTYEVAGRRYESTRVRFSHSASVGKRNAWAILPNYPAGSAQTVYYDPADPAEAVLESGLGGHELFMALLLVPFNAITIAMWAMGLGSLLADDLWPAKIASARDEIHVRFAGPAAVAMGFAAFALTAVALLLLLALPFGTWPPYFLALAAWIVALGAGGGVWLWQFCHNRWGRPDLILHLGRSTLTRQRLRTVGNAGLTSWAELKQLRARPQERPLAAVRAVEVRRREMGGGDERTSTFTVVLTFARTNGPADEEFSLATWPSARGANAFADWLRAKLGLA